MLKECRAYFHNQFIAITSFDSGPLILSEDERELGWDSETGVAFIPPMTSIPPSAEWDEWYLFPARPAPELFKGHEVFVNYSNFGLYDPEEIVGAAKPGDDLAQWAGAVNWVREMQSRFWEQLARLKPETFISDGGKLVFVTKNRTIAAKVAARCGGSFEA
ncbi:hypothetical protein J8F10_31130 [Gemmata sp. G18]|uniref:Uncharacterized protein n=1 Tax=Gemmata palustris TaxID=2822762 RepID=A0ABS5C146_9BACT|nr:hypothetical protein [Gemmata palustris]MBP3959723.1 hypothetical protein [Gemmata palustris]